MCFIGGYLHILACNQKVISQYKDSMINNYVFSSESVGEGHPDKVADYISDSVLDACLEQDKFSRVACETLVKSNCVVIAGEITTKAILDYEKIVRKAINEIGYVNDDDVFHADKVFVSNLLTKQSPDIAQGVDARKAKGKNEWFVGGITDENKRTLPLSFDFLEKGKKYEATIYADGKDAHYLDNPHSYTVTKKVVTSKSKLNLALAAGGGVAISIKEIK